MGDLLNPFAAISMAARTHPRRFKTEATSSSSSGDQGGNSTTRPLERRRTTRAYRCVLRPHGAGRVAADLDLSVAWTAECAGGINQDRPTPFVEMVQGGRIFIAHEWSSLA